MERWIDETGDWRLETGWRLETCSVGEGVHEKMSVTKIVIFPLPPSCLDSHESYVYPPLE